MFSRRQKESVPDRGTDWKLILVSTLEVAQKALDNSSIPGAGTCISLVLTLIEAADVAADNQEILANLATRYEDLTDFLVSVNDTSAPNIPTSVRKEMNDLEKDLKALAERWQPLLLRPHRKRDWFMRLIRAQSESDMLKGFLTGTDERINSFLVRFAVQSWIASYAEIIQVREEARKSHAETQKDRQTAILALMPYARYASYKSLRPGGGGPCLDNTRTSVLKRIDTWALDMDPHAPPVFWLNGVAGIGKTTIAHSVAAGLDEGHHLGGSFLFLRADDELQDGKLLFPTLAFQLCSVDPLFKSQLAQALENDPGCIAESPRIQFEKLIRQPMSAIAMAKPLIFVLDALDECHPDSLQDILWAIVNSVKDIPFLRVLITSRPEGHIREGLCVDGEQSAPQKLLLHVDMHVQEEVEKDIRLYLKTSLQDVWTKNCNPGKWPPETDLDTLVRFSGKLFIYAATMVRFIGGHPSLDLQHQLDVLLSVKVDHIPVSDPYRRLDQLYLNIVEAALPVEIYGDRHYLERFRKVVGSIVLMKKPLPLEVFSKFLGNYNIRGIHQTLYNLHSIIIVPEDASQAPRVYHLSFPNFITSAERCTNKNAYIDPQIQAKYLLLRCLETMKEFFGPVISSKRRPQIRNDTADFVDNKLYAQYGNNTPSQHAEDELDNDFYQDDTSMPQDVRYSNNHWCSHLISINVKSTLSKQGVNLTESGNSLPTEELEELLNALERFIYDYFSLWLAKRIARISSTSGAAKRKFAEDTFDIMYNAHHWMGNIDSQQSMGMKQIIRTDAQKAFASLFPSDTGKYRFGDRVNEHGREPRASELLSALSDAMEAQRRRQETQQLQAQQQGLQNQNAIPNKHISKAFKPPARAGLEDENGDQQTPVLEEGGSSEEQHDVASGDEEASGDDSEVPTI